MKSGDIMAIMHPERFQKARSEHKEWNDVIKTNSKNIYAVPKEITIDTAFVVDRQCYETGIKLFCWKIPERYNDEKSAEIGHKKWVEFIKRNIDFDLSVVVPDTWG